MPSTASWPTKTSAEHLDYTIDWSARLKTDRIANSAFTLAANSGMTISANTFSNTAAIVWLDGGTSGLTEEVHNVIETVAGRIMEAVISIQIKDY